MLNDGDVHSAEIACLHHGCPISPTTARTIAIRLNLPTDRLRLASDAETSSRPAESDLMRLLIEVLLTASSNSENSSTLLRFVNAQAGHLDMSETLDRLPDSAPVAEIRPFLERGFRRAQHSQHEAMILKMLAIAQYEEADEALWTKQKEMGGILAEEDGMESPLVQEKPLFSLHSEDKILEKLDRRTRDDMGNDVIELR